MNASMDNGPIQGLSLNMAHIPASALKEYLQAIEPFAEDMLSRQMHRENAEHPESSGCEAAPGGEEIGLRELLKDHAWGSEAFIQALET